MVLWGSQYYNLAFLKYFSKSYKNLLTNRYFSTTQVMILRNHGIVICGETIEEALLNANNVVKACKYQVRYNSFI